MGCLRNLQENTAFTVSYLNKIFLLLRKNNYPDSKSKINSRIEDLKETAPQYCEKYTLGFDSPFFDVFEKISVSTYPRQDKEGKYIKRNLGIFSAIPDRYNDPDDKYIDKTKLNGDSDVYPILYKNIKNHYKKYYGYLADLNWKYDSSANNFLVLGEKYGEQEAKNISVTLNGDNGEIQSNVTIVGIQKAAALCGSELKFKDLVLACEEARKKFAAKLIFGKEITKENIGKGLFSVAGPPAKIYHYLQTLYKVSEIIINKNIDFDTANFSLVEMLNSHGLLCSPDEEKYNVNKCQLRKFENESGKKILFNIHLKPATYSNKVEDEDNHTSASQGTVRIYLDWDKDKKQIRIGWIGKHRHSCRDCPEYTCRAYPRKQSWA
jgi:hypothetical protein